MGLLQFEYKRLESNPIRSSDGFDDLMDKLNELGKEGWNIIFYEEQIQDSYRYIVKIMLKREI
jgi:hypothetical protein